MFKMNKLFLSMILLFIVMAGQVFADAGFSKSCKSIRIKGGHLLAECRRIDGSWNEDAKIKIDNHIGNNNGNLEWDGSSFSQSCQNIIIKDGHILKAECRRIDGSWNRTEINLDERIGNNNGELLHQ
jgi:hypothetical protein